ncbi:enoyl-CoA hydratase-related protein [Gordonia sp. HY002]|uniref:enoyl-CoA hydratase/isomerase family protein n=1 Tax=Gordonia zhenghanii TaxID=2911516 RepID=UPI001EF0AE9E|nr:enoyl-CoA hydratase-related protein [Gordonia zhenghanii]MCF8571337.1 enoyl-CoA hydratase-related protein [Gordonia zhenghanii]MCF8601861.1 enoyl-CoA hydratase-related protein [Gordonia zhenghanii]
MLSESISHTEVLEVSQSGAARHLTLDRPEALNTFDTQLQEELRTAVDAAARDDSVRCVVLTGRGRAFSAGADLSLDDLRPDTRLAPRTEEELRMRYNPTIRTLRTMDKPVVAAVNGSAIGLGCALAMACDQVVAAEGAWFSLAFAKVGLTLDAGASLLIGARIGIGRATRMAMLGTKVDATTAQLWGMVDEVVPDNGLIERASTLAETLASGPTGAFAATKQSLNTALLGRLDATFEAEVAGQSALVDAADFREGVAAFAERRAPTFTGR